MAYSKSFQVRWADVDANGHMKSTAYSEYAAHTRLAFLAELGFDIAYLHKNMISPVYFQETLTFFRECRMQEDFTVNNLVVSISESGHKWHMKHEIKNSSGAVCGTVDINGAWFSLKDRKVVAPQVEIRDALLSLPRAEK